MNFFSSRCQLGKACSKSTWIMLTQCSKVFVINFDRFMPGGRNIVGFSYMKMLLCCSMETLWWYALNLCCISGNLKGTWYTTTTFVEVLIIPTAPYNYTCLKFHDRKRMIQLQIQVLLLPSVMVMAAKWTPWSRKIMGKILKEIPSSWGLIKKKDLYFF